MRSIWVLPLAVLCLPGCSRNSDSTPQGVSRVFSSAPVQTWAEVGDVSSESPKIRQDLAKSFCVHVYKLPLKADFTQELAFLCSDNQPSALFDRIDRYAGYAGDRPRSVQLELVSDDGNGFTSGTYATVYRTPVEPKWVRSAAIPSYMVAASNFDYVQLQGAVLEDLTSTIGGDLQFGKWRLSYHADVQTPAQTRFSNDRQTELNSYQVEGGNPDIGIGAEHLTDVGNPDFGSYNTTTITIGNQGGGSTLITIIRLSVRNNGFPELAAQIFSDIATSQATQVHDGILREKAAGHFPE